MLYSRYVINQANIYLKHWVEYAQRKGKHVTQRTLRKMYHLYLRIAFMKENRMKYGNPLARPPP